MHEVGAEALWHMQHLQRQQHLHRGEGEDEARQQHLQHLLHLGDEVEAEAEAEEPEVG